MSDVLVMLAAWADEIGEGADDVEMPEADARLAESCSE